MKILKLAVVFIALGIFILIFGMVLTLKLFEAFPGNNKMFYAGIFQLSFQKSVSVIDYGAKGDGRQNDAIAIQKALDSDAEIVTIPEGIYSIDNTLLVGSGKTLKVDPKAVIRLANEAGNHVGKFLLSNRNTISGDNNIIVDGGIWDGNNKYNQRGKDGDMTGYTGVAINFINVNHLTIRNLTVRNPDAFSIRLGEVVNFVIEDVFLDHSVIRPNQDGIHIGGFSEHGTIRRIKAIHHNTPNDDMIAINADDDVERVINLGMKCGPIKDIIIEDIEAEGAYSFIRLLSKKSSIKNINIKGVTGSCRFYAVNINNWRFPLGSGNIKNIRLEDFNVTKIDNSKRNSSLIKINLRVNNVYIHNFQRGYFPQTDCAFTLLVNNECENSYRYSDSIKTSFKFIIPNGNIDELWINQ